MDVDIWYRTDIGSLIGMYVYIIYIYIYMCIFIYMGYFTASIIDIDIYRYSHFWSMWSTDINDRMIEG